MFKICVFLIASYLSLITSLSYKPCALREYKNGFVCVCNATYCDELGDIELGKGQYLLVSSSKSGLRFVPSVRDFVSARTEEESSDGRSIEKEIEDALKETVYSVLRVKRHTAPEQRKNDKFISDDGQIEGKAQTFVSINRNKKYQKMVGFGGAFTGSVSYIIDLLPEALQNTIYQMYYSKTSGIAYNLLRKSIGGCDFDLEPWAYNEMPANDLTLSNFTKLDIRDLNRIRQIKQMKSVTQNEDIKIMGAAWSSPPWMKTNNQWSGYGALKPEYYQTWADYHVKYLKLMSEAGLPLWAISTGNEPLNGEIGWFFVKFMSLGWAPKNQGKWLAENLAPALRNSTVREVKIFGGDDQRYTFPWWFDRMNSGNTAATSYLAGLAVHWYWDELVPPFGLDRAHEKYPDKIILNTESSLGDKPFETHGPELGSWARGERYINTIIQNFEHWVNGWIDWNLVLNEAGGPNYINNNVDVAVVVNTTSKAEIYKQPIFYALGHFSKFIREHAVRFEVTSGNSNVKSLGFENPDSSTVIILYNKSNGPISIVLNDGTRGEMNLNLLAKSIHTIFYE